MTCFGRIGLTRAKRGLRKVSAPKNMVIGGGNAAISGAIALPCNKFKIQIAKAMVKRAILACK